MTVSMVVPHLPSQAERLDHVIQVWKDLAGDIDGKSIGYDEETNKSESMTTDRNWALGLLIKYLVFV